jgi:integrase
MPRLSKEDVTKAIASGESVKLFDGNSLCLHVRGGSALWIYHYRDGQTMRTRSLGSAADMSPAAARRAREDFAAERRKGRIPRRGLANANKQTTEPNSQPDAHGKPKLKHMRFADVVESFIALQSVSEWKVKSREPENYRRLKTGTLGKMWAHEIDQTAVKTELQTRWGGALANAEKYRIRIELVINHAVAKEARTDIPNPARKEIMEQLIAKPPKTVHRPAMRFKDVPAFFAELVADGSPSARALAFAVLTVARNTEARLADWTEIVGNDWIIPGGREERSMKEGLEHAMPLSPAALALLGERKASGLIFGQMHRSALLDKLHVMRDGVVTVHGFRTSFTSWARKAGYPKALRELAKAHAAGRTATDAAYERDEDEDSNETREDQLKALRPMLEAWADFVTG